MESTCRASCGLCPPDDPLPVTPSEKVPEDSTSHISPLPVEQATTQAPSTKHAEAEAAPHDHSGHIAPALERAAQPAPSTKHPEAEASPHDHSGHIAPALERAAQPAPSVALKPWQKLVSAPGLVRRGNATAPAPVLPVAIMKPMASRLNPEEALDSLHAEATDSHEAVQRAVDERDGGHNLLMGQLSPPCYTRNQHG